MGRSKFEFFAKLPDHTGNVGQFSMANEPSLHVPYLYDYAGAAWKTQKRIRQMLRTWFRKTLYDVMCEEMKKDKARHTILPLSKFGLMQITRQRVRPAVEVDVQEKCPFCNGTGTIQSSFVVVDEIESNLRYLRETQGVRCVTLVVHPYIHAYISKGIYSKRMQWMFRFGMHINIKKSESIGLLEHKILNANGDEVVM